ncbi:glycosyltransferase [Alcanivorax sp.]|uniref:glycosyltransferase n=1 Tax=Alcanivorax sp. TaxID=1872427 RepID=UPI0025C3F1E7|nr:glycosyltransferase [Alcanivorax sp.]
MMLVVNMFSVKSGGGLQNALSFLSSLINDDVRSVVVCVRGGHVHRYCEENSLAVFAVWPGILGFLLFHFFHGAYFRFFLGSSLIFTIFGPPPFFSYGARTVSGFAYSNIIQFDVDFWGFLPFKERLVKKIQDFFRLTFCRRSDEIIVETEFLKDKALGGVFRGRMVHVVKMQPSNLLASDSNGTNFFEGVAGKRILYLSGPHPNKRIHLLAKVFSKLSLLDDYKLIITLPHDSDYLRVVNSEFSKFEVSERLINVGPVYQGEISDLISQCDAMINVSLLESFSNNWVESWFFEKPLFVTDSDWALASCRKAASYINPENPNAAAQEIHGVFTDESSVGGLVEEGLRMLIELGVDGSKYSQYMNIIGCHENRGKP